MAIPRMSNKNAGAALYTHKQHGFKLLLPWHLICNGNGYSPRTLTIGQVVLSVDHRTRTLSGDVPASWLIDLSAEVAE